VGRGRNPTDEKGKNPALLAELVYGVTEDATVLILMDEFTNVQLPVGLIAQLVRAPVMSSNPVQR